MPARDPLYRPLARVAVVIAVVTAGWLVYEHVAGGLPGRTDYRAANTAFTDARYGEALGRYRQALAADPTNVYAAEGIARSLQRLGRGREALAAFEEALAVDPDFAPAHANRAILLDTLGRHEEALAGYRRALQLDPELAEGMHWLDRLLYDVRERPPTIADRMAYLEEQLALPESERRLTDPGEDARQRPYER